MVFLPVTDPLVSRASGSVGSVVYSHNQFGSYTRARTTPANPNTPQQQVVRNALAFLTARWRDVLTEPERRAWDLYALNVSRPGRLGRANNVTGLAMYVRSNVPRLQAASGSLPLVDAAPTWFNLPQLTPITQIVLNIVDDTIHPFFSTTDPWLASAGNALMFWVSPPQPLTVNFYKGPYRFAGFLTPPFPLTPASPASIPLPFPAGPNQRVFVRYRPTLADGRLTSSQRLPADVLPQIPPVPILATQSGFPTKIFTVTFDQTLKIEAHSRFNWTCNYNAAVWRVTGFNAPPGHIPQIAIRTVIALPGLALDFVSYAPPPFDVHSFLTGLPVAAFTQFPVT